LVEYVHILEFSFYVIRMMIYQVLVFFVFGMFVFGMVVIGMDRVVFVPDKSLRSLPVPEVVVLFGFVMRIDDDVRIVFQDNFLKFVMDYVTIVVPDKFLNSVLLHLPVVLDVVVVVVVVDDDNDVVVVDAVDVPHYAVLSSIPVYHPHMTTAGYYSY